MRVMDDCGSALVLLMAEKGFGRSYKCVAYVTVADLKPINQLKLGRHKIQSRKTFSLSAVSVRIALTEETWFQRNLSKSRDIHPRDPVP